MRCEAQVNGIRIAYESFGDPLDPAIVLIHGLGTQMIGWPETLCRQLCGLGYYVVRFDNRDVGKSSNLVVYGKPSIGMIALKTGLGMNAKVPYQVKDMAEDCLALLNYLKISSAHVVGASMGGMIAQWLGILYPERVLSLTLMMTSSGRKALPGPRLKVRMSMLGNPSTHNRDACITQGVNVWKNLTGSIHKTPPERLRQFISDSFDRGYNPDGVLRQLSSILVDHERCSRLREISAPTLVLHGGDDPMLPKENGIDLWHRISNSKLELIDGWGHDFPLGVVPKLVNLIYEHVAEEKAEGKNDESEAVKKLGIV